VKHGAVAPQLLDKWDFINIALMDEKRLAPSRFPATIISRLPGDASVPRRALDREPGEHNLRRATILDRM